MKLKQWLGPALAVVFLCVCLLPQPAAGSGTDSADHPVAAFDRLGYRFSSVVDGTRIVHDFPLVNKGKAPLEVKKVRTG